jgi:hypothetical protein
MARVALHERRDDGALRCPVRCASFLTPAQSSALPARNVGRSRHLHGELHPPPVGDPDPGDLVLHAWNLARTRPGRRLNVGSGSARQHDSHHPCSPRKRCRQPAAARRRKVPVLASPAIRSEDLKPPAFWSSIGARSSRKGHTMSSFASVGSTPRCTTCSSATPPRPVDARRAICTLWTSWISRLHDSEGQRGTRRSTCRRCAGIASAISSPTTSASSTMQPSAGQSPTTRIALRHSSVRGRASGSSSIRRHCASES